VVCRGFDQRVRKRLAGAHASGRVAPGAVAEVSGVLPGSRTPGVIVLVVSVARLIPSAVSGVLAGSFTPGVIVLVVSVARLIPSAVSGALAGLPWAASVAGAAERSSAVSKLGRV
jgi:hypothetical protein